MNKQNTINSEQLLTPAELAELLNIGRRTFQTWRAAGKLPTPDLQIGKIIRWKKETIQQWLDSQKYERRKYAQKTY